MAKSEDASTPITCVSDEAQQPQAQPKVFTSRLTMSQVVNTLIQVVYSDRSTSLPRVPIDIIFPLAELAELLDVPDIFDAISRSVAAFTPVRRLEVLKRAVKQNLMRLQQTAMPLVASALPILSYQKMMAGFNEFTIEALSTFLREHLRGGTYFAEILDNYTDTNPTAIPIDTLGELFDRIQPELIDNRMVLKLFLKVIPLLRLGYGCLK